MSDRPYLQHGSRHRRNPLGSDPIPGHTDFAWVGFNQGGGDTGHNQSIPSAGEEDAKWYTFMSSDTTRTVFATYVTPTGGGGTSSTPGDTELQLMRPGVYDVVAGLRWESGTFDRYCYLTSAFGISVLERLDTSQVLNRMNSDTSNTTVESSYNSVTLAFGTIFVPSDDVPGSVKLVAGVPGGAAKNIVQGSLGCTFHPGDDYETESDFTVYT
jgi:hypothetical protein